MADPTGRYYVIDRSSEAGCVRFRLWERTDRAPTATLIGEFHSAELAKAAVPATWHGARSSGLVALAYLDAEATIVQISPARTPVAISP